MCTLTQAICAHHVSRKHRHIPFQKSLEVLLLGSEGTHATYSIAQACYAHDVSMRFGVSIADVLLEVEAEEEEATPDVPEPFLDVVRAVVEVQHKGQAATLSSKHR